MQESNARDKVQSSYLFSETKNKFEYNNIHADEPMLYEIKPSLTNLKERVK